MTILPVWLVIFIAGMLIAFTQIEQEWVFLPIMWATLFIMMIIGFALMPTRYQIFTDRIRIVLGWVLHFDIPFNNIENITAATRKDLGVLNLNFINSFSGDDIMQIVRKRGANVHITPWERDLFLENLNKAMNEWKTHYVSY